ncbi:MAG: T9SS type A sorting domain-containing protein [Edaphocola sp.]
MKIVYRFYVLLALLLPAVMAMPNADAQQNNERILLSNQDRQMTVFPVPANTSVNVRISAGLRTEVERVEIVSLIGRKITEQSIIDKNTTEVTFNNLADVPQGIYMVVARDKSGRVLQSSKMVVNR